MDLLDRAKNANGTDTDTTEVPLFGVKGFWCKMESNREYSCYPIDSLATITYKGNYSYEVIIHALTSTEIKTSKVTDAKNMYITGVIDANVIYNLNDSVCPLLCYI